MLYNIEMKIQQALNSLVIHFIRYVGRKNHSQHSLQHESLLYGSIPQNFSGFALDLGKGAFILALCEAF